MGLLRSLSSFLTTLTSVLQASVSSSEKWVHKHLPHRVIDSIGLTWGLPGELYYGGNSGSLPRGQGCWKAVPGRGKGSCRGRGGRHGAKTEISDGLEVACTGAQGPIIKCSGIRKPVVRRSHKKINLYKCTIQQITSPGKASLEAHYFLVI